MAPLPPDSTDRYFFTYHVNGHDHTMQMRVADVVTDAEASASFSDLVNAMAGSLYASLFVRLERSFAGSNVRVPATYSGDTEWGTGESIANNPSAFSFTGKSSDGRRFAVQLFGRNLAPEDDWRTSAVDSSSVSDALEILNNDTNMWRTISGLSPILNAYANQSMNAYWQRQART